MQFCCCCCFWTSYGDLLWPRRVWHLPKKWLKVKSWKRHPLCNSFFSSKNAIFVVYRIVSPLKATYTLWYPPSDKCSWTVKTFTVFLVAFTFKGTWGSQMITKDTQSSSTMCASLRNTAHVIRTSINLYTHTSLFSYLCRDMPFRLFIFEAKHLQSPVHILPNASVVYESPQSRNSLLR